MIPGIFVFSTSLLQHTIESSTGRAIFIYTSLARFFVRGQFQWVDCLRPAVACTVGNGVSVNTYAARLLPSRDNWVAR